LRIISGFARGLKLKSPHGQAIRPTSDRAREALFNIIGNKIQDSLVLDLFAGTGAFGIEALSRGARQVVFVDNSMDSLKLIKKNLQLLPVTQEADTQRPALPDKVPSYAHRIPSTIIKNDLCNPGFYINNRRKDLPQNFDLIFLDPPYAKGLSLQSLTYLDKSGFLAELGLLIAEDRSEVKLPESFTTLTMFDKRRYGDTTFWFYKNL
jgi:16S rRNA (guanine966-N2)-methyltransferase